jgi:hypothetical protein
MDLEEMWCDVLDGIHLAVLTDSWWALADTVTKLRVTKKGENIFWLAKFLTASNVGLCCL